MNLSIGASVAARAFALEPLATEIKPSQAEIPAALETSTGKNLFERLGNFDIQRLMSQFNQAETLSSNVLKKLDDTTSAQQQKIG